MTQTPRTPIKWIVPIPDNDPFGRKTFTMACRGNTDIGSVLNYFVYDASRKAEHEGIDISKVEYITLENRLLDAIVQRTGISKKTLIAYIKRLEEWKHIVADAYRHRYNVYFKNVTKDIEHPPEPIKPKLRGIHAANCKSTLSTISGEISVEEFRQMRQEIVDLYTGMLNLQSTISNQQSTIVKLQGEIFSLQSLQSSKSAPQQGLNPIFDTPNSSNSNQEIEESIDAPFVASPSFSSDTESHSHVTVDTTIPVTDDATSAFTGQADVIPIAMGTMKPDDKPNEAVTQASSDMVGVHGYEKGVSDESSTDSIWDRDAGSAARDSDLLPPADRPFTRGTQDQAIQETQTAQVTQQTPLSWTTESALSSDARERTVTPPGTALLPSHPFYAELDIFAEDIWIAIPGRATETARGEGIRASGATSLEVTSDDTNDAVQESTTTPVSLNKTVQTGENKKAGPPIMPEDSAPWNAETLVQVCEAYKGRRYPNGAKKKSDRIRDTELVAAQTLLTEADDIWTEDMAENRENLLKIIKHVQNRKGKWWLNNVEGGYVNPHHLVDKDRIHAMWDELQPSSQRKNQQSPPNEVKLPSSLANLPNYTYNGEPLTYLPRQETRSMKHGKTLYA